MRTRNLAALLVLPILACVSRRASDSAIAPDTNAAASASPPAPAGPGHYANVHGMKMYYETHGQGPALVLLHGGSGTVDFWPEAVAYFSKDYQVIAPEQMGHGRTADDPKRALSYHGMAEDTAELLRQLAIESAYVVGWSDGGIVGLDLAMNHPTLVKKLVTAGANARVDGLDADTVQWLRDVKAVCAPGEKDMEQCWPSFLREPNERLSPDGAKHWPVVFARMKKMWLAEPAYTKEQLGSIKSPTLLVIGDHDMVRPQHAVDMFQSIPGAALWIVPNANHFVPKKRAKLFHETVAAFFVDAPLEKHE